MKQYEITSGGAEFELNQDHYTKDDVQYLRDTYGPEGWNFKLLGSDIVAKFNSSKFPLSAVEQGIATIITAIVLSCVIVLIGCIVSR